jgi:glutamate-1-semialdehyde 2,1-aminomutase
VVDYQSARQADMGLFARFFQKLLSAGTYWPPSQFEAAFISTAHSDEDIQLTLRAVKTALSPLD